MKKEFVAPCGMNCAVYSAHLALRHDVKSKGIRIPYCEGCRHRKCAFLKKRCQLLLNKKVSFCYECSDFPCERLKHIDNRYKTHFHMSLISNLEYIKDNGMSKFLNLQQKK